MWAVLLMACVCQYEPTGVYAAKISVTLWTYPGCGPCATTKANLGKGDADFVVTEKVEAGPTYTHRAYPVLTAPGRAPLVGLQTKAAVRKWLGLK